MDLQGGLHVLCDGDPCIEAPSGCQGNLFVASSSTINVMADIMLQLTG